MLIFYKLKKNKMSTPITPFLKVISPEENNTMYYMQHAGSIAFITADIQEFCVWDEGAIAFKYCEKDYCFIRTNKNSGPAKYFETKCLERMKEKEQCRFLETSLIRDGFEDFDYCFEYADLEFY